MAAASEVSVTEREPESPVRRSRAPCAGGLRPSSQCSLLTLWLRGIAVRSGRALDARRLRYTACSVHMLWCGRRFRVRVGPCPERSDTTFRLVITPPPRPRGRGTNGGITSSLNARETGGAITRTGWAIPNGHVRNILYGTRVRAGVVMNHRGKTKERPGHRGLISTRVPSKCPLVRPRQ